MFPFPSKDAWSGFDGQGVWRPDLRDEDSLVELDVRMCVYR